MTISGKDEMMKTINNILEKSLKEVNRKAKELLIQHINTDTYGLGKSAMSSKPAINKVYLDGTGVPSYEFRDKAWDEIFERALNEYSFRIFYKASNLSPPSKAHPYLHGNASGYNNIDRRNELAELLNISGVDTSGDWGWKNEKKRDPFWDNFIKDLREKLGKWLYDECKSRGLNIPDLKNAKL